MEKLSINTATAISLTAMLIQHYKKFSFNINLDFLKPETDENKRDELERLHYLLSFDKSNNISSCVNFSLLNYISENLDKEDLDNVLYNSGVGTCSFCKTELLSKNSCKQNYKLFENIEQKYIDLYLASLRKDIMYGQKYLPNSKNRLEDKIFA